MSKLDQNKTPYLDALKKYLSEDVLPLDVPGHHMGNVSNKLKTFLGDQVYRADVNAPIGMDNLANPHGDRRGRFLVGWGINDDAQSIICIVRTYS